MVWNYHEREREFPTGKAGASSFYKCIMVYPTFTLWLLWGRQCSVSSHIHRVCNRKHLCILKLYLLLLNSSWSSEPTYSTNDVAYRWICRWSGPKRWKDRKYFHVWTTTSMLRRRWPKYVFDSSFLINIQSAWRKVNVFTQLQGPYNTKQDVLRAAA